MEFSYAELSSTGPVRDNNEDFGGVWQPYTLDEKRVRGAVAILAGPVYRHFHRDDELFFMYGYVACFDAIGFGCVAALLQRRVDMGRSTARVIRGIAGGVLAATYFAGIDGHEALGFSLIALSSAFLTINAFDHDQEAARLLPTRLVCWFGRHSYELYLFHIIVLAGMRNIVPKGTLPYAYKLPCFGLFLLLSAVVAGTVSRFFAEPLNAGLRRHLSRGY